MGGLRARRRARTEPGRRLLVELLEERRDLVRRYLLEEREHHRLPALHELLGPEADAGEHGEAAVVELDDLLAEVLLGRELVLGPGREALEVRVRARDVALLHLEVRRLPSRERRRLDRTNS